MIDAVHPWQDLAATDAIHLNEAADARGADAPPTGCEAIEEGTEPSAAAAADIHGLIQQGAVALLTMYEE